MAKDHLARKLAVILHADVVGSTSLVQKNETLAHERIQATFNNFSETIAAYGGVAREIRGDALVAEFNRASDAVTAAIAFQALNIESNATLDDDILPLLRIGISLGEVIVADNTITGTGVVLAQRLEQLADPGGVVLQGSVTETVPDRLPFEFESLGEQKLKGFDQPVRAFKVSLKSGELMPVPERDADNQKDPAILDESPNKPVNVETGKPSIAVLPFENMSRDAEQEYFVDGLTEDIITGLSKFHSLFVVARNSSSAFKGHSLNMRDIGSKLGVSYLVEGSIRKVGNRVRVTAQLIEAETGNHIWADRYDRDIEDIFAVQDELVGAIVTLVGGKIEEAGKMRAGRMSHSKFFAYDLCLRAQSLQDGNTKENYDLAEECLLKAIGVDPNLAKAYHQLSLVKFYIWKVCWTSDLDSTFTEAFEVAQQAVALDDTDSLVHAHLCMLHIYRREFEQAGHQIETAIRLNANDANALGIYGFYLCAVGEPERAIELFVRLDRFNPVEPGWITRVKGIAYLTAGRYEDAILVFNSLESPPNIARGWLAASLALAGRLDEARTTLDQFLQVAEQEMLVFPGRNFDKWRTAWRGIQYQNETDSERFFEGLRKAGLE